MNLHTKRIIRYGVVAGVSSFISLATFVSLNGNMSHSWSTKESPENGFARPVSISGSVSLPAVTTDFTVAAENTVNAVVHIKSTEKRIQQSNTGDPFFDLFFGNRGNIQPQPQVGYGSGVIISSDGYIVTNNHVIDRSDEVEVTLNDKRSFNAKVIGTDPSSDLALLKIEATDLPSITFGDSDRLKVGEWVLAVGNPFTLTSTVTAGIVSAKARSIGILANQKTMGIESFIQTDAAVNPGNSGGALVNTAGQLVGINTAIFSQTGNFTGYSFAVPVSIVSKVITDLKQYGAVQRALLGVSIRDINAEFAKNKGLEVQEGAYVEEMSDRSAATEGGMERGDIIKSINGIDIRGASSLQEQISRYRPGDKIRVTVVRGKGKKELSITLKNQQGNTEIIKPSSLETLGAAFKELKAEALQQLGLRNGIQVSGIKQGKFEQAGIRNGFIILRINDRVITKVDEIEKVFDEVTKSRNNDKVMFIVGVYPNGKTGYYAVDLTN